MLFRHTNRPVRVIVRSRSGIRGHRNWLWLGLLLVLSACLSGGGPRIVEFQADPSRVAVGSDAEVVLSWTVENAEDARLSLDAVPASGPGPTRLADDLSGQQRFIIKPTETATYRLILTGPAGTVSSEVVVEVVDESAPGAPRISSFASSGSSVSPGQEVDLSWTVSGAEELILTSDRGLSANVTGENGYTLAVDQTTTFMLTASNDAGSASRSLTVSTTVPTDAILILIAGQSNASGKGLPFPKDKETADEGVWMLTQGPAEVDWYWVPAEEPTHTYPNPQEHSFGVRLGNELKRATGLDVYLVPAAHGGSSASEWLPGTTFFEEAVARAKFASKNLGIPVSAVTWFQGETDSGTSSQRSRFVERTREIFDAFNSELGAPILFAQLSKRLFESDDPNRNLAYQVIREQQRMMGRGAVSASLQPSGGSPASSGDDENYYHLVVSHDLPVSDVRHLSRDAQKVLGQRFAHAFLVQVWTGNGAREANRAGPRVSAVTLESTTTVRVRASRAINDSSSYAGYFTLFVDGSPVALAGIERDPADHASILIHPAAPLPAETGRIEVRYMPRDDVGTFTQSSEAVHATDVSGLRLPLPAFGLPVEPIPTEFLRLY
jgi:hypothetical protein